MTIDKHCEMPNCSRPQLIKLENESSTMTTKAYCPACGRTYSIPTLGGNLAPFAPIATVGLLAGSIIIGDIEGAIKHGKNTLLSLFG